MELPRQPEPVTITFKGDPRDVDYYLRKIQIALERHSYDHALRVAHNKLVIRPAANND